MASAGLSEHPVVPLVTGLAFEECVNAAFAGACGDKARLHQGDSNKPENSLRSH